MEINDFEHRVQKIITYHGNEPGFPQPAHFGIDQRMLDSYLFDKQAIIDSEGSERTQYLRLGIVMLIPIVVLGAFPMNSLPWKNDMYTFLIGAAVGLLAALAQKILIKWVINQRLKKLAKAFPNEEQYVQAVLNHH